MRFSYMLAFWIIAAGAYAYDRNVKSESKLLSKTVAGVLIVAANMICAGLLCFYYINDGSTMKRESAVWPIIVMVLLTVCLDLGLLCQKDRIYRRLVWIIVLAQTFSLELISIYTEGNIDSTYIAVSNEVSEDLGEETNPFVRIKADASMNQNYPVVMRSNAASSFQPFNSEEQTEGMIERGYASVGVKMSDFGGTLVSDALMGVKYAFAKGQVSESLYQKEKTYGDRTLYHSLYYYEQGIKPKNPDIEFEHAENPFVYQNQLAEAIVGTPLLNIFAGSGKELSLQIEEESVVYLFADNSDTFSSIVVIDQNSERTYEFDLSHIEWTNEILELGVWENASLEINIVSDEQVDAVSLETLPLDKFESYMPEVCDGFEVNKGDNSLSVSLRGAADGEYLYLPLYPDDGWKCVVNGEEVPIKKFAGIGMAIPMRGGDNHIELSFAVPGLLWGIVVSVIGLLAFGITQAVSRRNEYKVINQVLFIGDEMVFAAIILVFYIIPVICLVIWGVSAII